MGVAVAKEVGNLVGVVVGYGDGLLVGDAVGDVGVAVGKEVGNAVGVVVGYGDG